MLGLIAGGVAAAVLAGAVYLWRERLGVSGAGLAALRTVALAGLMILLVNPTRRTPVRDGPPVVLLDASLSMSAAGGRWREALDTARVVTAGGGALLRFGGVVRPFDSLPPEDVESRLAEALAVAQGIGGAVVVITDGELSDAATLTAGQLAGVRFIVLPRDTVPNVALLDVAVPEFMEVLDSLEATLTVGVWGEAPPRAVVEVFDDTRRVAGREVTLPASPGIARRTIVVPGGSLRVGERALRLRIRADGDREPRDDERIRVVTAAQQPAIVVLADPPDWEARFLVTTLSEVTRAPTRGFARVTIERWIDMRSLVPVEPAVVQALARDAAILVLRSDPRRAGVTERRRPTWLWPASADGARDVLEGDWYVMADDVASPLGAALAGIAWDSLPPLQGVVPVSPAPGEWTALSARRGRRGALRPVVLGSEIGSRRLVTAGEGMWRWAFRGGSAREAYRSLLAAGVDWLLGAGAGAGAGRPAIEVSRVASRGMPIRVTWRGDSVPDSVMLRVERAGVAAAIVARFGPDRTALVPLDTGVYRWSVPGRPWSGLLAVEGYSPEFPLSVITPLGDATVERTRYQERDTRRWWWFVVIATALVGEWAWRQRRGLP